MVPLLTTFYTLVIYYTLFAFTFWQKASRGPLGPASVPIHNMRVRDEKGYYFGRDGNFVRSSKRILFGGRVYIFTDAHLWDGFKGPSCCTDALKISF